MMNKKGAITQASIFAVVGIVLLIAVVIIVAVIFSTGGGEVKKRTVYEPIGSCRDSSECSPYKGGPRCGSINNGPVGCYCIPGVDDCGNDRVCKDNLCVLR